MTTLFQDVRYGLRLLRKSPGFTSVAVLTLALGIGANTAIFSVIDARFLQPLEFNKPDQLVDVNATSRQRGLTRAGLTLPEYLEWKQQNTTLQGMAFYTFEAFTYTQSQGASRVTGWLVSPDFFDVLGEKPLYGRFFSADEDQTGKDDVVIIGENFWRAQLAGNPSVIGQTLRVDSRPVTIIGIERARSTIPIVGYEMYKPLPKNNDARADRNQRIYGVIGRLKDGVTLAQAQADMATVSRNSERLYPATDAGWMADIDSLHERSIGAGFRRSFYVLLAAVLFLLLIACLNIASLLTARMTMRAKEVSLRTALGAARSRLLRQFLIEGLELSFLGGIGGLLVSIPILKLLIVRLAGPITGVHLDTTVLLFTTLLCGSAGIVFAILPAWGIYRASLASVLKDVSGATTAGSNRMKLQNLLVIAQLAVSLVLLSTSGLLIRSFIALRDTDPGFRSEGVLVNSLLVLPRDKYTTNAQCISFFQQLLERIRRFPEIEAAGGITSIPLVGNSLYRGYEIIGKPPDASGNEPTAVRNVITEDYFRVLGIPVRRGRDFRESDNESAPRVALINEELARQQFKNLDPIGQRIILHGADAQPYEIVGVVGGSRQFRLSQEPAPEIFTPYRQSQLQYMYILTKARGNANPFSLAAPIRAAVHDLDPDQPVGNRKMETQFENSIQGPRLYASLVAVFAALALILAAVGVYGVLSYLVAQRMREIGIRIALGATRANVWNQVLGRGLLLTVIGLGIGVAISLGLTRAIASLLYHVGASDPWSFAAASAVLLLVAFLACNVPAYRAAKVDPMVALRYE